MFLRNDTQDAVDISTPRVYENIEAFKTGIKMDILCTCRYECLPRAKC